MRTPLIALGLWALVHLAGCTPMVRSVDAGPCAVEASMACQVERSSRVP